MYYNTPIPIAKIISNTRKKKYELKKIQAEMEKILEQKCRILNK